MDPIPSTPDEMLSDAFESNPNSPASGQSSQASTPLEIPGGDQLSGDGVKRLPSLRSVSDPQNMNPNSTPLGTLSNARRPPASSVLGGALTGSDAMLKARSLAQARLGKPPPNPGSPTGGASPGHGRSSPVGPGPFAGGFAGNMRLPPGAVRPGLPGSSVSSPVMSHKPQGLSARRGMKLQMNQDSPAGPPKLSDMKLPDGQDGEPNGTGHGSKLNDFKKYIDAEKGWITFEGAATITNKGVNFSNGKSFHMSLEEVEPLGELGKGNYGTVYKVRHARPTRPRFGQGLSGFRASPSTSMTDISETMAEANGTPGAQPNNCTGIIMAMKEIRLELDEAKFTTILKELVILHECVSPYIIDFYGAFFQEGAVYMCIEYMDGGSIDKLYTGGIPEEVLRRITYATIMGLKTLKDEHNIIHRDVKPTNILINRKGQVKICDFGVSGNLVASIAKTNIGCQSYMAPERISGGGMNTAGSDGTYSVQSDIWSLGLTIIECALGRYPYPPEVASTIFSQLSAIVDGEPPNLPADGYSQTARDFVRGCLNKVPKMRPTYAMLLKHPWMKPLTEYDTIAEEPEDGDSDDVDSIAQSVSKMRFRANSEDVIVAEWVKSVLDRRGDEMGAQKPSRPALHAAPLDSVSPAGTPSAGP
ncbi:hypothetical protein jhhlp_004231 [Lomentospora prolificans]|uniref:mitogen-activated protein kinase kinase n=1 Tax=Lomentospora prolificans TaxID=41688 RepID=A0A2N3NB01_9PEZI|nr:hypothetical protein jhhlp_004231 [Lomentospora prolificans]